MSDSDGYFGQFGAPDDANEHNLISFLIRQELAKVRTSVPVKITAVHGGGVGPAPTVDVQILINQTDGVGNKTDHGIVYGIPVARNQGGTNAVINDPQVGDLGHMVVSDRDISTFKNTAAQANPGSFRRHSMSDGVYHAAIVNTGTPKQYLNLQRKDGVDLKDVNKAGVHTKDGITYIGGDPADGGTFDWVMTASGQSAHVKAKI